MEISPEQLRARLQSPSFEPRSAATSPTATSPSMSPGTMSPMLSPVYLTPRSPSNGKVLSTYLTPIMSPLAGIITEAEIESTPLDDCHKELTLMHYRRLMRIATQNNPMALPAYTTKTTARDQLARMTLVIRDFVAHYDKHHTASDAQECACGESLIGDIIDASFNVPGVKGNLIIPSFPSPLRDGRDYEVAALVQESYAGNLDDVTELWNVEQFSQYNPKVVPDTPSTSSNDLGMQVDWGALCMRASSESNLLHYFSDVPVDILDLKRSQVHLTKVMLKGRRARISVAWPPTGRSRSVSETSEVDIDWVRVRTMAAAQRLRLGREIESEEMIENALNVLEELMGD
ncbi:hypothetical protein LTR29_005812 [Friedmanniomyces endolithicus]|nr:hypothetical protein LTR29_005812 [Friedmanniomyces endolithicus]